MIKLVLSVALVALLWMPAQAQLFIAGIKTGVPLTDLIETRTLPPLGIGQLYSSKTKRYTFGPTAEIRLPFGLGVEFDALYKRISYDSTASPIANFFSSTTGNRWEFPLLIKYRFAGVPIARPFVSGGYVFQSLSDVTQFTQNLVTGGNTQTDGPAELQKKTDHGIALGTGLEVKIPFLRFTPELRYTRWGSNTFRNALMETNQNQIDFLLGFTF
jgi:hypothetical protein